MRGQCQPLRQPLDVRVDDDAVGSVIGSAQHDVGRLARHAGQRQQSAILSGTCLSYSATMRRLASCTFLALLR